MWSNMQYITTSPRKIWNNTVETEKKIGIQRSCLFSSSAPTSSRWQPFFEIAVCMPLATGAYYSDTRSITTPDLKDPGPSRYPSYPAHRVHFKLKICVLGTACKLISFWPQGGLFVYTVVEIQQANSRLRHWNHYELSQDGFNLALIAVCSGL